MSSHQINLFMQHQSSFITFCTCRSDPGVVGGVERAPFGTQPAVELAMFCSKRTLLSALLLSLSVAAQAEAINSGPPRRTFTKAEIEAVAMPDLTYDLNPRIEADFEKYFFFHREDTSFDQAFADISECDALAHGINHVATGWGQTAPDKVANFGPVLGTYFAALGRPFDAIFASGKRRWIRRYNIRTCMFYKGYDRYGLEKRLWQAFHFEEGFSRESARDRLAALLKQARVASGPKPPLEVLEP